ncbi:helix-turn-helix domain-containing protein [Streptomyces sp. DH12]|uniref:helix-turn-helix transcriptional regulator n=1 Tax=Streptomyces sp. DH12 TaxID=2857010 RepID=UPI001E5F02F2|nr:helix-turn-helix domain-containing protein [Streptomyces sp. DH12]
MTVLRTCDWERVLDLAVGVLEARTPEHLWRAVARELLVALDAGAVVLRDERGPVGGPGVVVRRAAAPAGPRRPGAPEEAPGGMFGACHVLDVPLPGAGGRAFLVYREGRPFTSRDRLYCARVRPLLAAAAERCAPPEHPRPHPAPPGPAGGAGCAPLTGREATVLRMLSEGLPAAAMARRLGISVRTVHKHLENLYRKLGTADRLGAVLRAQRAGLLAPARAR